MVPDEKIGSAHSASEKGTESVKGMDQHIRHAVIIAAGMGLRFGNATRFHPKPLLHVAGVPLIRRTLLTARRAGLDHFTVVTGYRAQVLEEFLHQEGSGDLNIQCIHNEKWRRPNGLSVLRAKGEVPEPFVLLMSDHLFDAEILRRLLEAPLPDGHCRLAVDFHPENIMDLADATKVEVRDGRVLNIGKEIERYNGIDTGIFLCSHEIFAALEAAVSKGNESLSDGIRELALRHRMEATDIGEIFWQDIDDEAALLEGERRLEQLAKQKDNSAN
jgi:1L-myo-inositol 1-phosphate cytidylyltransferase / CDP-L-myo-inositol myo-inositolphosphotransferase